MGRRSRVAGVGLLGGALLLAACKRAPDAQPEAATRDKAQASDAGPAESIYDAQGRLKASREQVEWLEIPMGFQRKPQAYGRHVLFEAQNVPLEKARAFFAARMFTGEVLETAQHVLYRAVLPLSADERAVRLHLELTPRTFDNTLLLDIERISYDGAQPLSVDEARQVLKREQTRAE